MRRGNETKYLRIIICFFLFQFLFVISPLTLITDEAVSQKSKTKNQEKDSRLLFAKIWNRIGIEYYKKEKYKEAIGCFRKALELNPNMVFYIINLSRAYSRDEKFGEAQQLLKEEIHKFPQEKYQKMLQVELSNVHSQWAETLRKKYDHQDAIKHFEMAYKIDKVYRPKVAAIDLNNIGSVYHALDQSQKALEYYEKALLLFRALGNQSGEATTLSNIGVVYFALGKNHKALKYYQKALTIKRSVGDRSGEAHTLTNIGAVYSIFGQNQKALKYFQKALPLFMGVGDRSGKASIFSNIGEVYSILGQYQKALEYFEKALPLFRTLGNRFGEATTLSNMGTAYSTLGQNQKALEYFERALSIRRAIGDRSGEATILTNIGAVYSDFGQKQKALEYYEKALPIRKAVSDWSGEATTLDHIGVLYSALGQKQKALDYYEKALSIRSSVGDRSKEAETLNNIGVVYAAVAQYQKALEYYEKALKIHRAVGDQDGEAATFHSLMSFWENLKKIRLSIFFGKQSVNIYQLMRVNISSLDKKLQITYLESKKNKYRNLATILISEGRLSEAQQVLDMLKEEEYFKFIRKDRSAAINLSTQVDFTEFERHWTKKYNNVIERLSNISGEYHILTFKKNKNEAERKRMEELESEVPKAKKAYEKFLNQLKNAFDQYEKDKKAMKEDVKALEKKATTLQDTLKYLDEIEGGKNVALHYLVYENSISAIITLPNSPPLLKQWEIDEKELNKTVMNYITFILKSGEKVKGVHLVETSTKSEKNLYREILNEMLRYEKKLYDLAFKPVADELQKYGATNLMISLDGVLRYIPIAALWDGESYLVQRYRMALITPSSLRNIKDLPVKEKKILGLGASRGGQGFAPLPYVRREIRSIVKDEKKGFDGLIKGKAFIDDDFTRDTMVSQLKNKKYPLIHISSHFKFSPGDETKNHLLLGDSTTMKLSETRRMGKLFDNVKLLVLSACQTGVGGNGEEIDSFGELAQQSGAKSVIASLWPVADESTKELMVNFYRILKEGNVTSKIEALRQAQLELAGLEDLLSKDKREKSRLVKKKTKYSHPYYWGPFIMIGNWR